MPNSWSSHTTGRNWPSVRVPSAVRAAAGAVRTRSELVVVQGTVKFFDGDRGFGFISREKGDDVFVHFSQITQDGYKSLEQGQRVSFEITEGPKGLQASEVKLA